MIQKIPHDHPGQKSRDCKSCGEFKSPDQFPLYAHKACYGGYQAYNHCFDCEKERKLKNHLKRTYNLELSDYNRMVVEQNNRCHLCGEEPSDVFGRLVVDHCHKTGKVRKLLCRSCNIHLSKIEACPDYFERVKQYLA